MKECHTVNGGQAMAGIYQAMKKERRDVSQVTAQVKLTVLPVPGGGFGSPRHGRRGSVHFPRCGFTLRPGHG